MVAKSPALRSFQHRNFRILYPANALSNIGTWAQTDDMRPGLGWDGLVALQKFVKDGGVLITSGPSADWAMQFGFTQAVGSSTPQRGTVTGTFLRTRLVDDGSPLVYGVAARVALGAVAALAGFAFAVDEADRRTTIALPEGWKGAGSPCWVSKRSGEC